MSINPAIYLPYLQGQLLALGTKFIRRHVAHIRETFTLTCPPPAAVVNATGLQALKLGGVEDKTMYPTRGQMILVTNECSRMYGFNFSALEAGEREAYVIPRPFGGGTVLGGSHQEGNW